MLFSKETHFGKVGPRQGTPPWAGAGLKQQISQEWD